MWQGRRVVLGVTGGIAAYKCVLLARELTRQGAEVDVVLSRGAAEFVGPVTFEAVTRRPVRSSLWERDGALDHVALGQRADLVVVAPATAHLMARAAAGLADDLLTSMLLASTAPVLLAPAMNDEMFANPATQANLATLLSRGWRVVGPGVGALAEGPSDRAGRMAEPDEILAHAARAVRVPGPLAGRRVIVTAGPTREPIDPVRVLTNRSSGKMGYRLAAGAWQRGAVVTLISGPSSEREPTGVALTRVDTTAQMAAAVRERIAGGDVLIMAAAPADYRPASPRDAKLPRSEGGFALELVPTDDILLATARDRPPDLTAVGFALETGNAIEKGRAKLHRKQLDMIVVNDALDPGAGFDVDTNAVTILDRHGAVTPVSLRSKAAVAEAILDAIEQFRA
jgi:phosphopantothenoylcysteine decarboxylase/phosphopantothenate--cysteine ligase